MHFSPEWTWNLAGGSTPLNLSSHSLYSPSLKKGLHPGQRREGQVVRLASLKTARRGPLRDVQLRLTLIRGIVALALGAHWASTRTLARHACSYGIACASGLS